MNVNVYEDRDGDKNGDVTLDSRDVVGVSVDVASAVVEFEDLPCLRTPIFSPFFSLLLFVENNWDGWRPARFLADPADTSLMYV